MTVSAKDKVPPTTWKVLNDSSRESVIDENDEAPPPLLDDLWLEPTEAEAQELRQRVQNIIRPRILESRTTIAQANVPSTTIVNNDNDVIWPNVPVANKEVLDQNVVHNDLENNVDVLPTLKKYLEQEAPELLEEPQNARPLSQTRIQNPKYFNNDFVTDFPDKDKWIMFVKYL